MNKDQRLLEEAYEKVHNIALLPEEEQYIQKVCEDIYANVVKNLGRRMIPRQQHLYDALFHNPAIDHLSVLKYPESLNPSARNLYGGVWESLARNVLVRSYREPSGRVTRENYFHVYTLRENSTTQFDLEVIAFEDKEKVLANLKNSFVKLLQREIRWAIRDEDKIFEDFLKWRDRRFRDIKTTKELSKDFSEEDLKALEDF